MDLGDAAQSVLEWLRTLSSADRVAFVFAAVALQSALLTAAMLRRGAAARAEAKLLRKTHAELDQIARALRERVQDASTAPDAIMISPRELAEMVRRIDDVKELLEAAQKRAKASDRMTVFGLAIGVVGLLLAIVGLRPQWFGL